MLNGKLKNLIEEQQIEIRLIALMDMSLLKIIHTSQKATGNVEPVSYHIMEGKFKLITELEGQTSTGKSTFLYTMPTPLVVAAFDSGAVRALYGSKHEWFSNQDIRIIQYPMDTTVLQELKSIWKRSPNAITVHLFPQPLQTGVAIQGCMRLWNDFSTVSQMVIADPDIPSFAVDTMTIARRVAADCHLEWMQKNKRADDPMRQQLLQVEWGKPGDMVRSWYTQAQNQSEAFMASGVQKHFVVSHHLTETRDKAGQVITRANGDPVLEMEGLHNTYRFVDVALRLEQVAVDSPVEKGKKVLVIQGTFQKCGYNLSLKDSTLLMSTWDNLVRVINTSLHPLAQLMYRDED